MSKYGYARVSTVHQKLERQLENLSKVEGIKTIYSDKFTGTTLERPNFNKLLKVIKQGDTIIFDSVSRMSRNAAEGCKLYKELFNKGINLIFLKEPYINTDVYKSMLERKVDFNTNNNKIMELSKEYINNILDVIAEQQIIIAFEQAEKERNDISERIAEGHRQRKLKGLPDGAQCHKKQTRTSSKQEERITKIIELSKDFEGNQTDKDIIKLLGMAKNTYYKYKKLAAERV